MCPSGSVSRHLRHLEALAFAVPLSGCATCRPGQASFRIGLLVTFSRVNGSLVRLEGKGVAWISCLCCPLSGRCLGCIRVCTGALKLDSVRYWVLFVKRFCRVARVCQFGLCAMYPSVLPYGSGCLVYVRVPVSMGRVVYSKPHAGRAPNLPTCLLSPARLCCMYRCVTRPCAPIAGGQWISVWLNVGS